MAKKNEEKRKTKKKLETPKTSDQKSVPEVIDKNLGQDEINQAERSAQFAAAIPQAEQATADPAFTAQLLQLLGGEQGGQPVTTTGDTQGTLTAPGTEPPVAEPVEPLPEASLLQRLGGLANIALPVIGRPLSQGLRDITEKRKKMKATDKILVDKALELMDTNPDAAALLMKDKNVLASFERRTGLDAEDIDSLAETAKHLPMSLADTIKASGAGFGVDAESRKITSAPQGEKERQGKVRDSLEQKYTAAGLKADDVTDLDVAMWDASSQQGRDLYEMQATRKGLALRNRVTNKVEDITPQSLESSNMELQPIKDELGNTLGAVVIDLDDGEVHQELWFDRMINQLKEEYATELGTDIADPEVTARAKKSLTERILGFFEDSLEIAAVKKGIAGSTQQDQQAVVPGTNAPATTSSTNDRFF